MTVFRLAAFLAVLVLSAGTAWAEGAPDAPLPLEVQWLKVAAQVISTIGMPGVIAGLLYLLKIQKDDREKERTEAKAAVKEVEAALREEQAFNRKVQEDRIASAAASADRIATVAVSSSNAIATAAEKNAGVLAICHEIKEAVAPIDRELVQMLSNQDGLFGAVNAVALKVGNGCRAP